jgi:hypothetical protein
VALTARESAERHAGNVQSADFEKIMEDFTGSVFMNLMAGGTMPPMPTTEWEILSEEPEGDAVRFRVRYSNDSDTLELETRWRRIGPDWKIVDARRAVVP